MRTLIAILCVIRAAMCQPCPSIASKVTVPPGTNADTLVGEIMSAFASPSLTTQNFTVGGSLSGSPSFGYCPPNRPFLTRLTPVHTMLLIQYGPPSVLIEADAAGNTVNAITQAALNQQLAAMGAQQVIDFNHEAIRLPNGYTALITHVERLYSNVQGVSGTVDILGDQVVVLDTNWQASWFWNAYDHLDINRKAILGETCGPASPANGGCPVALAATANDWLHGNSLYLDPNDGNLVMSLRNQDWVIKIAYQNGLGDGHVVWSLGNDGDFAMLNSHSVIDPWFSHQHDSEFETAGSPGVSRMLSLFDNSNTRQAKDASVHSRGQVLLIDEAAMTADVSLSVDMGAYSKCYGSAQLLPNGNFWFSGGYVPTSGSSKDTFAKEVQPLGDGTGNTVYAVAYGFSTYRTFRIVSFP